MPFPDLFNQPLEVNIVVSPGISLLDTWVPINPAVNYEIMIILPYTYEVCTFFCDGIKTEMRYRSGPDYFKNWI